MINLLPPSKKVDIVYARRNTKLLRWIAVLVAALAGIGLILVSGLFYINKSISTYSNEVAKAGEGLKSQKFEETQKRVEEISGSLKLVTQVLSREVLFSKLFKQIGSAIPPNASLTDLKIGKIEGAIDLTAAALDYNTATQVQVNLSDPANKIFDKADIVSITCNAKTSSDPRYPCIVAIRAQFAKNNPFLFISPGGGSN